MRLGDVCEVQNGFAFDSKFFSTNKESGIPLIRIRDILKGHSCTYYTSSYQEEYIVHKGDFLIGMDGDFNIGQWQSEDALLNQRVCRLLPSDKILPKFIFYFIPTALQRINAETSYATVKHLSSKQIKEILIPNISLTEQQRIVALLDAEFAKIDALKANAEKNLKNAKDLFISTLSKELKHREGWKETKIGEFCEIIRGKRFVRADIVEKGVPCIHYGDIYTHYGLFATKAKGCVSTVLAKKLRFANKNDVIVVAAGENRFDIGVGVAWLGDEPAVVHDACFILKHSQNPMFLSFYLRSAEYHQYLKDEVNEGKICSFLTKPLAEAKISLPSLEEQEQIVKRLEIVSTNCKAMQENYKKTLTLCDDLKQALLRKAFNGEI